MQVKEYFEQLRQLLKQEKEEDLRQYREKMMLTSLEARREGGICWYPIVIRSAEYGPGERLMVELERTVARPKDHMFGSGKTVSIFANADKEGVEMEQVTGVINYVQGDKMMITLNEDELPEGFRKAKLGVNLLFDDSTYREMERTLKNIVLPTNPRTAFLRDVLIGKQEAAFDDELEIVDRDLNEGQLSALKKALSARDVALIHGPPGTGKTTTLVKTIECTLKAEKQVMVVAPSNAAVDLLVEKLMERGISVVRMGHPARITESILSRTFDAQFASHRYYTEIKKLKQKANQFFQMADAYKRNAGRSEKYQRKLLRDEAKRFLDEAGQLEFYISSDVLNSHQVIACTPVTAAHSLLRQRRFSTLFIDEAAQALEPACWIPIQFAERVILAGDHCQLPPTIKSIEAARKGLAKTLFEKLMDHHDYGVMLQTQYRMNDVIMGFSAEYFYGKGLVASDKVAKRQLTATEAPLEFIDTAGSSMEEETEAESLSKFNRGESEVLLQRLEDMVAEYSIDYVREQRWSIGIISPYKAQVKLMESLLEEEGRYPSLQAISKQWSVNSIDGFQGQERDIIAISLVRSNADGEIGFLGEERRMNVALTRAKKKLIVIGDSATIGNHRFYRAWIDYVEGKGSYRSVYEWVSP